nr:Protein F48C1.6 [Haemonchus contortus]
MSSDERKELTDTLRACTTEVTLTRGLPITAIVLGSLYYARTRLPPQYHFGPKGWPFYAIMGIGTLTTVNVFGMGQCRDRIQPFVARMWQKYNVGHSSTSYDDIRRRHRMESGFAAPDVSAAGVQPRKFEDPYAATERSYKDPYAATDLSYKDPYAMTGDKVPSFGEMTTDYSKMEPTFDMTTPDNSSGQQSKPMPGPGYMFGDTPTYMSGTPTTPRTSGNSSEFSR